MLVGQWLLNVKCIISTSTGLQRNHGTLAIELAAKDSGEYSRAQRAMARPVLIKYDERISFIDYMDLTACNAHPNTSRAAAF